jgi:hypothetical protein
MIFAIAIQTPRGERFAKMQPHHLLQRLLTIMERSAGKAPEVIALECMAEVDAWECIDESQNELLNLVDERGIEAVNTSAKG